MHVLRSFDKKLHELVVAKTCEPMVRVHFAADSGYTEETFLMLLCVAIHPLCKHIRMLLLCVVFILFLCKFFLCAKKTRLLCVVFILFCVNSSSVQKRFLPLCDFF